jgi:hypothetical protein
MSVRCDTCGAPVNEPARCTNGHAQRVIDPLERLADLLAGRLAKRLVPTLVAQVRLEPTRPALVSAAELARLTGMSKRWVYDHSDELGAHRTGTGPRPRLRFDPVLAIANLTARDVEEGSAPATAPRPRAHTLPISVPLLPVRGEGDE